MTKSNSPVRFTTGAGLCAALLSLAGGCATRSYKEAYSQQSGSPPMVYEGSTAAAPAAMTTPSVGTPGMMSPAEVGAGGGGPAPAAERVVIPLHQEQLQVSTRDVDAGAVRLRKIIKTETVNQPVTLRHEELVIERVPAGQTTPAANNSGEQVVDLNQPFTEQSITIPLTRQEPVIQTEIVQTGQVVAQRNVAAQQTTVQHPVRSEDIQIVKVGQPENLKIAPDLSFDVTSAAGQPMAIPSGQAPQTGFSNQNMGTAPAYQAGTAAAATSEPITSLATLTSAPDPAALAGRPVQFTDAKVRQVIGDNLVEIQGPSGTTVFVETQEPVTGIAVGDTIDIHGQVQSVPQSLAQLGLSEPAAHALQGRPIYIQSSSLQKAGPPIQPANP
jgi:uncharacterized protein (TIGR02271 family)